VRRLLILAALASAAFAAFPNAAFFYRFQNSAVDWSGNGRNGTVNGSGVYTTARGQQALYFDGTGDYVATPSFGLSGTVVVFAADVRCKTRAYYQAFLGDNRGGGVGGMLLCMRKTGADDLMWYFGKGAGADAVVCANYFTAPFEDTWLHLCVVMDYTGKKTYFYRDAVLKSTATPILPIFPDATCVKYIGEYGPSAYLLTAGYLANVQLWTLPTMPPIAVMNASVARIAAGLMPIW
jgi:hypothetical protein